MKMLRFFFKRISDDFMQKKLIPLKMLFFVHASTVFVLYPYLTIHMRELGINVEETAIMSAVTPVASIVMPPLAGMLADKIGNFKFLLVLSSILGGVSALLLLAVPVGRITLTFPPSVELLVTCDSSALRLRNMQEYSCLPVHPYAHDINLTVLSCGFVCELPGEISSEDIDAVVTSPAYDVHLGSISDSRRLVYRHTVTSLAPRSDAPIKDQSTSRILTDDPYFNTTVSRVSDDRVYFPTPQLYEMRCSRDEANETCSFGNSDIFAEGAAGTEQTVLRVTISPDAQHAPDDVRQYWVKGLGIDNVTKFNKDYDGIDAVTCQDKFDTVEDKGVEVVSGSRRMTKCSAACAASVPRPAICANKQQQIELDPVFTFWCYLAVRVFIGVIGGTAFAVFEGAVIAIVRDQQADYGMQRVYGSLGGMLSSPLSGVLIDLASKGKGYTDFRPAFYLYAVLKIATGVLMMSIDLDFKQPAQNLVQDVVSVFKNIEFVALFVACFIMGTAWGYIESFLFWLLQDLGASRSLMGITITVGGVAGLPLLVLSGPIIRRLGHANVLFIGFVFYAIRLMGYSLIYNPWLCLIFEALESVTSSLSFTAAVTYAARLSTTTTDTSVQGLLGGLYYGVGKGSGSLIGGYLMKSFGIRPTYQMFACATFVTGCMYFLFNRFYIRQRAASDENDICKRRPARGDVERPDRTNDGAGPTERNEGTVEPDGKGGAGAGAADGGSDSGVENPAYVDTEAGADGTRKEPKTG